ncbi:hypothetical protein PHLGIDRAFT_319637 [Phlebiopsis gigantea 11061_1 CR5-6]|uniref:Uncharacterized protein n=1 Tax=Phlebiopsis gigantea (strain 11061_1 CR5-6) TaxID=745531 RepID=A0A0C3NBV2_PHLG1|nr:hypothetical protein PHLGIDRAFT_319637 [Phlebiopsis gigantea 11061_1 CR5-6]
MSSGDRTPLPRAIVLAKNAFKKIDFKNLSQSQSTAAIMAWATKNEFVCRVLVTIQPHDTSRAPKEVQNLVTALLACGEDITAAIQSGKLAEELAKVLSSPGELKSSSANSGVVHPEQLDKDKHRPELCMPAVQELDTIIERSKTYTAQLRKNIQQCRQAAQDMEDTLNSLQATTSQLHDIKHTLEAAYVAAQAPSAMLQPELRCCHRQTCIRLRHSIIVL